MTPFAVILLATPGQRDIERRAATPEQAMIRGVAAGTVWLCQIDPLAARFGPHAVMRHPATRERPDGLAADPDEGMRLYAARAAGGRSGEGNSDRG